MSFNYSHPAYLAAREGAKSRSGGICQFCGMLPGEESHHWRFGAYKPPAEAPRLRLT